MAEELEQSTEVAIVPTNQSIVMPAVSAKEAAKAWKQYEELKAEILNPETDVQKIGNNDFKKKSYWKKLQTFFNLNTEIVHEEKAAGSTDDPMDFVYHFTVRSIAPNGRFVDAVGSCSSYEKAEWHDGRWETPEKKWNGKYMAPTGKYDPAQPNTEHNVRSTAYTRAANRAVSDLVGGGEVSAEEVDRGQESHTSRNEEVEDKKTTTTQTVKAEAPVETGEIVKKTVATDDTKQSDFIDNAMDDNFISDDEVEEMYSLASDKGYTKEQVDNQIKKQFGVDDPHDLDREGYDRVMNGLSQSKKKATV